MPDPSAVAPTAPEPRLDDRVLELLAASAGKLAFNGLRRTLGAHPESLTRALRRLERGGQVARADGGYVLRLDQPPPARSTSDGRSGARAVATVTLPPGLGSSEALGALAGRWFGRLRWVGVYEDRDDPWLVWSVADSPGHVLLSVRRSTLRVLVDRPRNDATAAALEGAAQELLVQSLTRLRRSDRGVTNSSVTLFARDMSPAPFGLN
ncbi:MAG TPA: hypothetical protein VEY07_03230 [Thermoplasmata archaeon]|nr:hypothetical protein [Thermoplasmata archaeon]